MELEILFYLLFLFLGIYRQCLVLLIFVHLFSRTHLLDIVKPTRKINRLLNNPIQRNKKLPDIHILQTQAIQLRDLNSLTFIQVLGKPFCNLVFVDFAILAQDLVDGIAHVEDYHLYIDEGEAFYLVEIEYGEQEA